jgi:hypothetical protein
MEPSKQRDIDIWFKICAELSEINIYRVNYNYKINILG